MFYLLSWPLKDKLLMCSWLPLNMMSNFVSYKPQAGYRIWVTLRRECFDAKSYHVWSLVIKVTNACALNCN